MSRFVARYRALFDNEIHIPKRLDLSEFGDLADYLHILVLGRRERFGRFNVLRRSLRRELVWT